jgi:hypothetical protein
VSAAAGAGDLNVSAYANDETATTREECALQRIEHLSVLGARDVIELCVGPSLRVLERLGAAHGIRVAGNDVDPRWARAYLEGTWVVGDALEVDLGPYDAAVFAPPLSRGCFGRREDALSIDGVVPAYRDFLARAAAQQKLLVLVLPGRSLSTADDRRQLHALIAHITGLGRRPEVVPLTAGAKKLVKYVDVYLAPSSAGGEP